MAGASAMAGGKVGSADNILTETRSSSTVPSLPRQPDIGVGRARIGTKFLQSRREYRPCVAIAPPCLREGIEVDLDWEGRLTEGLGPRVDESAMLGAGDVQLL